MISVFLYLLHTINAGVINDGNSSIEWSGRSVTINNSISYVSVDPEIVGSTLYLNNQFGKHIAAVDKKGRISVIVKTKNTK